MKVVSIRDIKANCWGNPVFVASLGGATRSFGDEINKTDGNPLQMHPEDFELYYLGDWDAETGEFKLLDKPQQIAVGSNFKS